ncbi:hypothetical protein THAOC_21483 [Thalassiosira oceanica]|uniref:Ribosomal protein eL8/eL30/eS12/Gadd45 domain-containing protein n=1 Tax=Thalassiosira oceanica TaxID=159749 RepID=K0S0X9_THAOC|nr:hypothetical protein THAOC_21483 [Thalassiosira oceanica]|eukprot:EJK58394.1 hypothetical protein THAOC_21483 [Thalassiosira oceanica]
MSGRWRSKHWQSSGGNDQHHAQIRGAALSRERRDNSRDRRPTGDTTSTSRRSSEKDYYDDRTRWGGSGRNDGGHRRGNLLDSERWRRGMAIPDNIHRHATNTVDKHAGDGSGDSSRPASAGRVRATFPVAPAQAWGNPQQPGNVHLPESRAIERKMDKQTEPTGQLAASSASKRGWAKPASGTSETLNVWGSYDNIKPGPSNKPIELKKNTKPAIQIMKRPAESRQNKNGPGSNKKATTANLASFLAPPTKEHQRNNSQSKPKKKSSSTNALLGKKRSAPLQEDVLKLSDFNGTKKGRQRLNPRKKKLTTLKKKVLKERLRVWQERNNVSSEDGPSAKRARCDGDSVSPPHKDDGSNPSTTIMLVNYIRADEDDLDDEEEFDEITSNLISLTGRVGTVVSVYIPRPSDSATTATDDGLSKLEGDNVGLAFARYASARDAVAARSVLDGIVVGGQTISVSVLNFDTVGSSDSSEESDRIWRLAALRAAELSVTQSVVADQSVSNPGDVSATVVDGSSTIVFRHILCDDDYEDNDALHESVEDLKSLVRQYAAVTKGHGTVTGPDKGNVYISVCDRPSADEAVKRLNGMIVGGNGVIVELVGQDDLSGDAEIVIENVLVDDDFADADCLEETVADIQALAAKFGMVGGIKAETEGEMKGKVFLTFTEGHRAAEQAATELNGMLIGGQIISAKVQSSSESTLLASRPKVEDPPPPMYSGDKIIPESFAECKRVPKIPNKGTPRAYASKIADERALPTLVEMLGELMRLQERSKDDKNARARRRLVMGLREVARGIRSHKVKMVVMANNLDEYGAIDSKLQEILDLAKAEDLPVIFELNKRKLGKALGKSIKISVVGVQNADGAHAQFKLLKKLTGFV